MEPLIILILEPNKRRKLPPLDYSGALLLRWQIMLSSPGVDPLTLTAQISAEQTIDPIGYVDRGQWPLPGGDRIKAPLTEIAYSPLVDWFITTPTGFRNSQLSIYQYAPPQYQAIGQSTGDFIMNVTPASTPPVSTVSTPTQVAASTNSVQLVPAKAGRTEGIITNASNRQMGISFDAATPASLTFPSIVIPPGGNASIPEYYVGPILGVCAGNPNGLTGSFQILEFIAQ